MRAASLTLIKAAQTMCRLHNELCELENHSGEHERSEFEPCSMCDEERPQKLADYNKHAELWAESFARYLLKAEQEEATDATH